MTNSTRVASTRGTLAQRRRGSIQHTCNICGAIFHTRNRFSRFCKTCKTENEMLSYTGAFPYLIYCE